MARAGGKSSSAQGALFLIYQHRGNVKPCFPAPALGAALDHLLRWPSRTRRILRSALLSQARDHRLSGRQKGSANSKLLNSINLKANEPRREKGLDSLAHLIYQNGQALAHAAATICTRQIVSRIGQWMRRHNDATKEFHE